MRGELLRSSTIYRGGSVYGYEHPITVDFDPGQMGRLKKVKQVQKIKVNAQTFSNTYADEMSEKTCTICMEIKKRSEYYNGVSLYCKNCYELKRNSTVQKVRMQLGNM
jgi:late competence protein required for DNA uptake (superfamily II DNA/RNA helicase)